MKKLFSIVVVSMLLLIVGFAPFTPNPKTEAGDKEASKPILRMELVHDDAGVTALLGDKDDHRREQMAIAQYIDLAFIPAYALLLSLCAWLNSGGNRWWRAAACVAIACIAAAGLADYFEDARILHLVGRDGLQRFFPPLSVDNGYPRFWALWKWGLFAACVVAEGVLIAFRDQATTLKLWLAGLAGAFAIAAGSLCLWSINHYRGANMDDRAIERTISITFAAVSGIVVWTAYHRFAWRRARSKKRSS